MEFLGNYKQGELPLMHQNLSNIKNMIIPEKSIFVFDRNYNAIELYARIIEKNSYFLVRLKDNVYKKKKEVKITSNDSPIKLELTSDRLKKFHNEELKEKYSQKWTIDLRIVTITLENGRRCKVKYEKQSEIRPVIEIIIQRIFGCFTTPQICGKKVLLRLLSPASRPLQVTEDLEHFWTGAWVEICKEMKGRYPKHNWDYRVAEKD